jgi:WD40 repeat protein
MLTPNQVDEDDQLLDIATDYLHFTTNFFEVIDVSATHIYHSALEISPLSSIVRKLYYSQQLPLPRVVIGIPDLWDPSIVAISTKDSRYLSSTWSPCSQFVAAVTRDALEIRDASTLKLLSTIQPIKAAARFQCGLAYSPDGRSLASCSNIGIVIWDTQTGGVVKSIACEVTGVELKLVWSLDGMTVGTISSQASDTHAMRIYEVVSGAMQSVCTYEVASGVMQSSGTLQSTDSGHLWAHNKSFWVMVGTGGWPPIGVFEVGSTLTQVEQFHIRPYLTLGAFSPTTYRISALCPAYSSTSHVLFILDVHSSKVLLQETGSYLQHTFSPEGTFFAAFTFTKDRLLIWRYTFGHYIRWREFQQTSTALQFSPTSSSILCCDGTRLHVFHLGSPAFSPAGSVVETGSRLRDAFPPNCAYIVTVHQGGSTVTITNLGSQNLSPSQFIDTGLEISAIALTGNVLLVKGPNTIVAWLLTEEGMVDGVFGNTRAGCNDSLWMIVPSQLIPLEQLPQSWNNNAHVDNDLAFSVEGEIAAIRHNGHDIHVYHTRTGEILKLDKAPQFSTYCFNFSTPFECDRHHSDLIMCHGRPKHDWPVSLTALRDGWVKDPEGKHRLWLYARWRSSRYRQWLHNGPTLRLKDLSELIIIKF